MPHDMASRHITFEDGLYLQLVQLNEEQAHRDFSYTVNLVVRKGLQLLAKEAKGRTMPQEVE
jgi:hypothetical protein